MIALAGLLTVLGQSGLVAGARKEAGDDVRSSKSKGVPSRYACRRRIQQGDQKRAQSMQRRNGHTLQEALCLYYAFSLRSYSPNFDDAIVADKLFLWMVTSVALISNRDLQRTRMSRCRVLRGIFPSRPLIRLLTRSYWHVLITFCQSPELEVRNHTSL